jgi:hypothetical protein
MKDELNLIWSLGLDSETTLARTLFPKEIWSIFILERICMRQTLSKQSRTELSMAVGQPSNWVAKGKTLRAN